jgi:hypothetical protein
VVLPHDRFTPPHAALTPKLATSPARRALDALNEASDEVLKLLALSTRSASVTSAASGRPTDTQMSMAA